MSVLLDFQTQIGDLLRADSYFSDITVISELKADIDNEIDRALGALTVAGGKIGICAIVLPPIAGVKGALPGPVLDPVSIAVHVEENVLVNTGSDGTGKPAVAVAERILGILHRTIPAGRNRPLLSDTGAAVIKPVEPAIGTNAYAVVIKTVLAISETISQAATPTASPDGGVAPQTVTLACTTPGAAIFYTIDGKYPSPTVGTLYTAPVAIAAACSLKAAAWLAGFLTSEVKTSVFT